MDNFAQADVERRDLQQFPALSELHGFEITIHPGDVLWLPKYWWHFVQQLEPGVENVSLSFWLGTKGNQEFDREVRASRAMAGQLAPAYRATSTEAEDCALQSLLYQDPQLALRAFKLCRLIEEMAARKYGPAGGEFLTEIAAAEDFNWNTASNASTFALRVRGLLESMFAGHSQAFLRIMTRDGRLHPGPPPTTSAIVSDRGDRGEWGINSSELNRELGIFTG